ncbi:flavodoxin family protein [Pyxidicoccus fallax]|uniref:Flavodoxin family protein n=1 Tax=Pyxidicoccus fallax TaxID=394095 RepID=A0A848LGW3_9BACT|nr:NAD(P)H-dependent oxidoreductase [Pyxidicoccus fallax]NMO16061.1 flavodoxin family protein [Pyxidicoccus fallax]NPC84761.1 flavodoxin family protein [Pyxidicoccus fallax]
MSSTPSRNILFLLSSSREGGNAELLARRAADTLAPDIVADWRRLEEHLRQPFRDLRHAPGGYPKPGPELLALAERTLEADEVVIVSPIYWYNLSSTAQHYLEHWSWWLRMPELRFRERMRGKVLSLITAHSSEEDDAVAQPPIQSLQLSADYMGMRWRGALIGHGSAPGQVLTDTRALESARDFLLRPVPAVKPRAA